MRLTFAVLAGCAVVIAATPPAAQAACPSGKSTSNLAGALLRSRGTLLRWTRCRDGASVQHLRVTGARHIQLFTDMRKAGIDPNATAWRFLSAHRLG